MRGKIGHVGNIFDSPTGRNDTSNVSVFQRACLIGPIVGHNISIG